jgi:hypothetical protein
MSRQSLPHGKKAFSELNIVKNLPRRNAILPMEFLSHLRRTYGKEVTEENEIFPLFIDVPADLYLVSFQKMLNQFWFDESTRETCTQHWKRLDTSGTFLNKL